MKPRNPSILRNDPLLRRVWEQLGRPSGCHVIGGYVRDRLIGRPSNDLDLTIEASADDAEGPAKNLARALGVRVHLLGTTPHRIWRMETDELKIEIWPLGELSRDEDIRRRDFSCNALSWVLPNGPLVDLVGGLDDLHRGRLRALSRDNLADDPVRLLRGPRFLAQLIGFDLDDQTRSWILDLAPTLAGAPRERVGQEFLTLLRGPAAARGLTACHDLGLFGTASPDSARVDGDWVTAHLGAADALSIRHHAGGTPAPQQAERHCGAGVSPALERFKGAGDAARLAFLFRAWGQPADAELRPYSWQKTDREKALTAARLLDRALETVDADPADRRELTWRAGSAFPSLLALAAAVAPDYQGWERWWRQWRRNPAALENPQPLLTGTEIAGITGIEPGPELGEAVGALLRAQVRGEVRSRDGAVRWLGRCL